MSPMAATTTKDCRHTNNTIQEERQDSYKPKLLWSPSKESEEDIQLVRFANLIQSTYGVSFNTNGYWDLYRWSIDNPGLFWEEVWKFTGIIYSHPWSRVVDERACKHAMDTIPTWFEGARLNFAENILRPRSKECSDDKVAIIYENEGGNTLKLTRKQLVTMVYQFVVYFRNQGIHEGDVIAAYAANIPEVIAAMLAAASLGAIFTTCPPDFGVAAVCDRLLQTRPKILLASKTILYNGKCHDQMAKIQEIHQQLPSPPQIILLATHGVPGVKSEGILLSCAVEMEAVLRPPPSESSTESLLTDISFKQLPFNHPLYILYSSGTTGKPKCLVHSAGGTLLQHLKEHQLHGNMTSEDVFFQYTNIGWMMWHWMVSALALGTTLVLYDGSPMRPSAEHLWHLIDRFGVTHFGISAKYLQTQQEMSIIPKDIADLSRLKRIYSTGSPLSPASFEFVYEAIATPKLMLSSITGGTDIISLFAGGVSTLPIYSGEIQAPCLGMSLSAFSPEGTPVPDGDAGDLVCTMAFPSMPVFFWNDDERGSLYQKAYFNHFPHVWYHGDFIRIDPVTKGITMLGRSDGTLNPAGVRFGSAELYNVINKNPAYAKVIQDVLVVGVRRPEDADERVMMFLQMVEGVSLDDALINSIKAEIRTLLSPRHVPAAILECPAIPYTLNGKKVEVAVKRILSACNSSLSISTETSSIANPESLLFFQDLAKQKI